MTNEHKKKMGKAGDPDDYAPLARSKALKKKTEETDVGKRRMIRKEGESHEDWKEYKEKTSKMSD